VTAKAFLSQLVAALDAARIPYMVTGSFASSAHGVVRGTHDIDVVITATAAQLRALVAQFPNDRFYADEYDALEALSHSSQFNIIDFATGWKADLILRKPREFSRTEFDRRRPHVINDVNVYVATPEDVLIAKLEWAKMGESERQIEDAAGVIATQGPDLDRAYVQHWVHELGLERQWERALERAR
jgi:hypothetical protein